jgi:hypothetical protein
MMFVKEFLPGRGHGAIPNFGFRITDLIKYEAQGIA